MSTSTGSLPRRWQDKTNLAFGLLVFVSPWLLGYTGTPAAAWNAWIMGAIFALGALAVLAEMPVWFEWGIGFFGLWTFLAPRILAFTDATVATVFQMIAGALIALLAIWSAISAANSRNLPTRATVPAEAPSQKVA